MPFDNVLPVGHWMVLSFLIHRQTLGCVKVEAGGGQGPIWDGSEWDEGGAERNHDKFQQGMWCQYVCYCWSFLAVKALRFLLLGPWLAAHSNGFDPDRSHCNWRRSSSNRSRTRDFVTLGVQSLVVTPKLGRCWPKGWTGCIGAKPGNLESPFFSSC